jgi:hypothetical protein
MKILIVDNLKEVTKGDMALCDVIAVKASIPEQTLRFHYYKNRYGKRDTTLLNDLCQRVKEWMTRY